MTDADPMATGVMHLTAAESEQVFRLLDESSPEHERSVESLSQLFRSTE